MADLIEVRATINLDGLGVGREVLVDPDSPFIADMLDALYLVPVDAGEDVPDEPPEDWPTPS